MPIELIGMIGVRPEGADGAAVHVIGGEIDLAWVRDFSRAHEAADFDKVLVGYSVDAADGLRRRELRRGPDRALGYLIAHRPGFVAPTLAARKAATLDHDHERPRGAAHHHGRQRRRAGTRRRLARPRHALPPHRRVPRRPARACGPRTRPFDHEGEFYRCQGRLLRGQAACSSRACRSTSAAPPRRRPVGAKHADVYMLWGEPLAAVKQRIAEVRAAAAPFGRASRASASRCARSSRPPRRTPGTRPAGSCERVNAKQGDRTLPLPAGGRRAAAASTSPRRPRCTTSGSGRRSRRRSAAPATPPRWSGTPEQVAESLLDYYDLGVTTLLIRGFDPLADAVEYGRELIPLVRAGGGPARSRSTGGLRRCPACSR